jgi:hypothetical protein
MRFKWTLALLAILFFLLPGGGNSACAQSSLLASRLSKVPGVNVTAIPNNHYAAFYTVTLPQHVNHKDKGSATFQQRIFVGLQSLEAPVVMVTDGYGVDYAGKPDYQHELAKLLEANLVVVEHRYFGKSQPSPLDYQWLTLKQSAEDVHRVKSLLDTVLVGKWITTGTRKGGQTALAHRMHYPNDAVASVVYGTAVKKGQTILASQLLKPLMETPCGMRVAQFQAHCFAHKDSLLPLFIAHAAGKNLDFGDLEMEVVLDYILLEFPYSFWQMGVDCAGLPILTDEPALQLDFLLHAVSPKFYTTATRKRWAPAYFMFYHELGYYEYDLQPFLKYLKAPSYSNQYFAPKDVVLTFDRSYLQSLRDFLDAPAAHSVYFIYGENDPWALQSTVVSNRYVVPNGSHKSKLADLPEEQRTALLQKLNRILGR